MVINNRSTGRGGHESRGVVSESQGGESDVCSSRPGPGLWASTSKDKAQSLTRGQDLEVYPGVEFRELLYHVG